MATESDESPKSVGRSKVYQFIYNHGYDSEVPEDVWEAMRYYYSRAECSDDIPEYNMWQGLYFFLVKDHKSKQEPRKPEAWRVHVDTAKPPGETTAQLQIRIKQQYRDFLDENFGAAAGDVQVGRTQQIAAQLAVGTAPSATTVLAGSPRVVAEQHTGTLRTGGPSARQQHAADGKILPQLESMAEDEMPGRRLDYAR